MYYFTNDLEQDCLNLFLYIDSLPLFSTNNRNKYNDGKRCFSNVYGTTKFSVISNYAGISCKRLKNPFGVSDYAMPVNDNNYNLEYTIYHYTKEPTKTFTPNTRNYTAPLPDPNFVTNGCITCNSFRDNIHEVYIDHLGRVHPCCFIGGDINSLPYMDIVTEVKHIQKILGKQNNLYYYSLEEIMNNNILSLYSNSWADKTVKKCWIQCGKKNSNRSVDNLFVEN